MCVYKFGSVRPPEKQQQQQNSEWFISCEMKYIYTNLQMASASIDAMKEKKSVPSSQKAIFFHPTNVIQFRWKLMLQ